MNNTSLGEKFCINAVACTLATTVTVSLKGLILSIEPIFGLKKPHFFYRKEGLIAIVKAARGSFSVKIIINEEII